MDNAEVKATVREKKNNDGDGGLGWREGDRVIADK